MGKVRLSIFYHGLLRPPLISFCTATEQAMSNARRPSASCMPRAPLIGGCGHTSDMIQTAYMNFIAIAHAQ